VRFCAITSSSMRCPEDARACFIHRSGRGHRDCRSATGQISCGRFMRALIPQKVFLVTFCCSYFPPPLCEIALNFFPSDSKLQVCRLFAKLQLAVTSTSSSGIDPLFIYTLFLHLMNIRKIKILLNRTSCLAIID
jgi:hypothetical protein